MKTSNPTLRRLGWLAAWLSQRMESWWPRAVGGVGIAVIAWLALAGSAPARERVRFDAGWRFQLGDVPAASATEFDDSGWREVHLPHDWSIGGAVDASAPSGGAGGFFPMGTGWYRKSFTVPASWQGQRIALEFEGVYMNADVWINGHDLGVHPYGYTSFFKDLTPYVNFGGRNVIAVRVDNSAQPNARWYTGSGIYRHVWLEATNPVSIEPWGVFVSTVIATPTEARVHLAVTVANETDTAAEIEVATQVLDGKGDRVGEASAPVKVAPHARETATYEAIVKHPRLWSPESPALYRAVTQVRTAGKDLDAVETTFGVRTINVSADHGFELNGRVIKLVGGSVHADNGPLGAAAFDRAEERRVELLKAAGFNAVRTAHNPPAPAFLAACDRLGLLVMDEAFDGWQKNKTPHDYGVIFDEWWQRDIDAMVQRDRNHPSVIMWSIGNEVFERATPEGARIARQLADRIRELDPTRPVTAGLNGTRPASEWKRLDPLFAALDVAGYNYESARTQVDHDRFPARVMVTTESYQSSTFFEWAMVRDHPWLIGDFVWSAMDYLGEAGIGQVYPPGETAQPHWIGSHFPWHGAYCGDIDLTGWRKPVSHYRAIVWDRGEKLYAAVEVPTPDGRPWNLTAWSVTPALPSWTWRGEDGKPLTVDVYSRYDAVRLYLNDRLLGEEPTTLTQEYRASFTVPYAPGILKAVGVQAGREVETFALTTAGEASQLKLSADRTNLRPDAEDLSFVTLEVTDAAGRLRPDATPPVTVSLTGPATLAALGNADLTSLETYETNPHHAYQGRLLIVVRANGAPGEITLTAAAPGLKPSSLILHAAPRPTGPAGTNPSPENP